MDEGILKAAGINYEGGLERFVGKKELYEKYLTKFMEDTHAADAKQAYSDLDYENLLLQVHTLKGLAGTLGLDALYEISADIVASLRSEKYDGLEEKMNVLDTEYMRILKVIKEAGNG